VGKESSERGGAECASRIIQIVVSSEDLQMNTDRTTRVGTRHQTRKNPVHARHARQLLVVIFAGMTVTLAACSASGSTSPTTHGPASAPPSGAAGADSIAIHNFAFSPTSITVAPGATVMVTNEDQVTHTLTASHGAFSTGDITSGQSKTFTAPKTPGKYTYFCMIHQYMTGTLVVSG
jgi:plastocyanin